MTLPSSTPLPLATSASAYYANTRNKHPTKMIKKRSLTSLNRTIAKQINNVGTLSIPEVPQLPHWSLSSHHHNSNPTEKKETPPPSPSSSFHSFASDGNTSPLPKSPLSSFRKTKTYFASPQQYDTSTVNDKYISDATIEQYLQLSSNCYQCATFGQMNDMESTSYWSDDSDDFLKIPAIESPQIKEGGRWRLRSKKSIAELTKRKEVKEIPAPTVPSTRVVLTPTPPIVMDSSDVITRKSIISSSRKYPPSSSQSRNQRLHRASAPVVSSR